MSYHKTSLPKGAWFKWEASDGELPLVRITTGKISPVIMRTVVTVLHADLDETLAESIQEIHLSSNTLFIQLEHTDHLTELIERLETIILELVTAELPSSTQRHTGRLIRAMRREAMRLQAAPAAPLMI